MAEKRPLTVYGTKVKQLATGDTLPGGGGGGNFGKVLLIKPGQNAVQFDSLTLAEVGVAAGDLILMFPGSVPENTNNHGIVSGVKYFAFPGYKIDYTGVDTNPVWNFSDFAGNYSLDGFGEYSSLNSDVFILNGGNNYVRAIKAHQKDIGILAKTALSTTMAGRKYNIYISEVISDGTETGTVLLNGEGIVIFDKIDCKATIANRAGLRLNISATDKMYCKINISIESSMNGIILSGSGDYTIEYFNINSADIPILSADGGSSSFNANIKCTGKTFSSGPGFGGMFFINIAKIIFDGEIDAPNGTAVVGAGGVDLITKGEFKGGTSSFGTIRAALSKIINYAKLIANNGNAINTDGVSGAKIMNYGRIEHNHTTSAAIFLNDSFSANNHAIHLKAGGDIITKGTFSVDSNGTSVTRELVVDIGVNSNKAVSGTLTQIGSIINVNSNYE